MNFIQIWKQRPKNLDHFHCFSKERYQEAGQEVEELGLELVPLWVWDAGVAVCDSLLQVNENKQTDK